MNLNCMGPHISNFSPQYIAILFLIHSCESLDVEDWLYALTHATL